MGAKQSSPTANGRTRAYSGSDLPSTTASSNGSNRSVAGSSGSGTGSGAGVATALASGRYHYVTPPAGGPRSVVPATSSRNQSLNIPNSGGTYNSQEDSEGSSPEENMGERSGGHGTPRLLIGSLPAHLSPHLFGGFKCPVCSKFVSTEEMDLHLVLCLTKPRVTYNEFLKPDIHILYEKRAPTISHLCMKNCLLIPTPKCAVSNYVFSRFKIV